MSRENLVHGWLRCLRRPDRCGFAAAAAVLLAAWTTVAAEALPAAETPPPETPSFDSVAEPAALTFFNRPIIVLRATVHGKLPADRAREATEHLRQLTRRRPGVPQNEQPQSP